MTAVRASAVSTVEPFAGRSVEGQPTSAEATATQNFLARLHRREWVGWVQKSGGPEGTEEQVRVAQVH